MEDSEIIERFFARDENALAETQRKFGALCTHVAENILNDRAAAEECVNDALMRLWETIPPQKPNSLRAYFAKITRNAALDELKKNLAQKRGSGVNTCVIDEIYDLSSEYSVEETAQRHEILSAVNLFLAGLPKKKREVLVLRYWYCCGVDEIARVLNLTETNVYNILKRERKKLIEFLERKGVLN